MGWMVFLWRPPTAQDAICGSPGDQLEGELFCFVIVLVKVICTRENLHIVVRGVYGEKEISFLHTLRLPSPRQA